MCSAHGGGMDLSLWWCPGYCHVPGFGEHLRVAGECVKGGGGAGGALR